VLKDTTTAVSLRRTASSRRTPQNVATDAPDHQNLKLVPPGELPLRGIEPNVTGIRLHDLLAFRRSAKHVAVSGDYQPTQAATLGIQSGSSTLGTIGLGERGFLSIPTHPRSPAHVTSGRTWTRSLPRATNAAARWERCGASEQPPEGGQSLVGPIRLVDRAAVSVKRCARTM
jgi:hypothetical protein